MPSDRPRTLEEIAEAFASTAEAAVYAFEHRNDGGMRVPFHGDFASAPPSVIGQLRWWARTFRDALSPPPGSREPGAGDAPRIRLHTGVVVTPDELAAMWQGRAAPPTTPAPDMRECATCGDLACLHREDGCHANESAAGCYVKCKRFVPPPPTPTPTEPRACPFCGHAEPRLSCNYCGWRVGRPPHTEHLLPSALARLTDPKTLRRALERGPSPETPAPEAGRPCVECKGRGWHPGDCHPRETCGVCDGSGFAPAAAPPTTPAGLPPCDCGARDPLVTHHVSCSGFRARAGPCPATRGPTDDDPHVYRCDRKTPHTNLHATGPGGEEVAWWCSCPECSAAAPSAEGTGTRDE
jgi:hypothetical protein